MQDSPRILVIDDNENVVQLISNSLSPEYTVDTAYDVPEGLSCIRHNHYDLIILDLGLPQISGAELIRMIRNDPFTWQFPILVISAFSELRKMIPDGTVSGFLQKPFLMPELVKAVKDIIDRPGRQFPEDILRDMDGGLLEPALLFDWSVRLRRKVETTRRESRAVLARNRELKEQLARLVAIAQELRRDYDRRRSMD